MWAIYLSALPKDTASKLALPHSRFSVERQAGTAVYNNFLKVWFISSRKSNPGPLTLKRML